MFWCIALLPPPRTSSPVFLLRDSHWNARCLWKWLKTSRCRMQKTWWLLRKHCSTLANLFSLCHLCDVSLNREESKIEQVITPYNLLSYSPGAVISLCNGCWRLPLGITLVMSNYLLTIACGKWTGYDIINSSGSKGSLKTNNNITHLVQFNVPKLWNCIGGLRGTFDHWEFFNTRLNISTRVFFAF